MVKLKACLFTMLVLAGGVSTCYAQATDVQPHSGEKTRAETASQADQAQYNTAAMQKMSEACVLLGQDKKDDAMGVLQSVEWKKTSIPIGATGMDYGAVVDYYMGFPAHDKASCDKYSQDLFADQSH